MDFLLSITPSPVLSASLWIVLFVTALYFARPTVHKFILVAGGALHKLFRTGSLSVSNAERGLAERFEFHGEDAAGRVPGACWLWVQRRRFKVLNSKSKSR